MAYQKNSYYSGIKNEFPDAEYRDIRMSNNELFSCVSSNKEAPFSVKSHYHEYIELIYVTFGSMDVTVNKSTYTLVGGDLIVLIPGDVHSIKISSKCQYLLLQADPNFVFSSILSTTDLHYSMPYTLSKIENARFFKSEELDTTQIPRLIYTCAEEYKEKRSFYKLAFRAALSGIALFIFRKWDDMQVVSETNVNNSGLVRLNEVLHEIDTNYSRDITAEEMAELAGMSYSYFSRYFKNTMGHTFSEYLNSIRIKEAENLLINSDVPISDIAEAVGFSNTSYFIVQFKKQLHMTPKKYRSNYSEI